MKCPACGHEVTDAEPATPPLLGELTIGSMTAGRGFVARRADRDIVYLVEAALAEHIPTSLTALRNRFVAPPPIPDEPQEAPSEPSAVDESPAAAESVESLPVD